MAPWANNHSGKDCLMKNTFLFAATILFIGTSSFAYDWSTNPGDGFVGNPYEISTPEQLMSIGSDSDLLDKHFVLTGDIVFDPNNPEHVFTEGLIAPYVTQESPVFSGHFDGRNFKIFNLKIDNGDRAVGLFGSIIGTGQDDVLLENIMLVDPIVSGTSASGSLVGLAESCKIRNCHVKGGFISNQEGIGNGGLLGGISYSTAEDCTSSANVIGDYCLGGLSGSANFSCLVRCSASGSVTGSSAVGGLLGHAFPWLDLNMAGRVEIFNCFATGDVHAEQIYGGGLIGRVLTGSVRSCYASGSVTGGSSLGGLAGSVEFKTISGFGRGIEILISQCYSTGNVDGQAESIGGLIGKNLELVKDCYASGRVTGASSVGGLCGKNENGIFTNCFWDMQTSGTLNSDGGTGKTTDQMKQKMTFTTSPANWDFVGESVNGENEIWRMCVDGVDYPRLSWEFAKDGDFACGDGVDIPDLQALAANWLAIEEDAPAAFNYSCDANCDGTVDLEDFKTLSDNW